MEANEVVAKHGLKPLVADHLVLGMISHPDMKADDIEQLHWLVTNDLLKLIRRMKREQVKVCALLNYDGDSVNAMAISQLKTSNVPVQFLTTLSPKVANNQNVWYVDNWRKSFLESCDLVLNYGNEELSEYHSEHEDALENVEIIDRPLRGKSREFQDVHIDEDPYAKYWTDVGTKMRVGRYPYRGIRINQVIDLRPPKI